MIINTDEYVDATTAAKMLNVTPRRISALVKENRLGETIRVGHTRLIPRSALLSFERLRPGAKKKASNKELLRAMLEETALTPAPPTVDTK